MNPLKSPLEGKEMVWAGTRDTLNALGFTLGGNWDYDHGCFDLGLDRERKVWLRLPFEVTSGKLDSESSAPDTMIRFGSPFVLKHVYHEGVDTEARGSAFRAMIDQFQEPSDPDARIEPFWVDRAMEHLARAERHLLG